MLNHDIFKAVKIDVLTRDKWIDTFILYLKDKNNLWELLFVPK